MEYTQDGGDPVGHNEALLQAFKAPVIGAGITLLLVLSWALWPTASINDFDILDELEPAPPSALLLDTAAGTRLNGVPLIAAGEVNVRGSVRLSDQTVVIANAITFEPGARIINPSRRLIIIAPRITGAVIDVSGHDGLDGATVGAAGGDGDTGGIALLAAAAFSDSRVNASGGAGGDGVRGGTGAAGRNGYCGPRSFGLAQRGATGGPGGAAGSGGSGGIVTLLYQESPANGDASRGAAGSPGRGGNGGRGGAGCNGLRGKQPDQPAGNEGPAGRNGSRGGAGSVDQRQVNFDAVIDAVEDWLDEAPRSYDRLRDRLLAIRPIEGA